MTLIGGTYYRYFSFFNKIYVRVGSTYLYEI